MKFHFRKRVYEHKASVIKFHETLKALRKRVYEHKASVLKDGQITPVSRHFKKDGHNHKHAVHSARVMYTKI